MHFLAFAEAIQLFPDGTIFIHIGLILLMIWVLNRTFFRPINNVIASRERFKGGHDTEADEILGQAAEKLNKYNTEIRKVRNEGYELIERQRAEAVAARQEKVAAVKAETAETLEREKRQLDDQTVTARAALAGEAEQLAEKITSNILKA